MRIDIYGSAAAADAILQSNKTSTDHAAGSKSQLSSTEDTTSLSSGSESVQSLTNIALQPIPSRESRVESLRQAVNNAQYKLDATQIANALSSSDV